MLNMKDTCFANINAMKAAVLINDIYKNTKESNVMYRVCTPYKY